MQSETFPPLVSTPSFVVRPGFRGKNVWLRAATTADAEIFAALAERQDPQTQTPVMAAIRPIETALKLFKEGATDETSATLTVIALKDQRTLGRLRYFNLNMLSRSADLDALWGAPDDAELVREGMALFISYLFRQFNLNSVTALAAPFNKGAILLYTALGFHNDGVLRQRWYHDGEYHDAHIYTLLRYEANL